MASRDRPSPERWEWLKQVFGEALALEGQARADHLARACGDDGALRAEVESLLASHERAGDFLANPPALPAADEGGAGEPCPPRIGPYRVLGEIGHGGMGTVFLATRDDGEFRREVAVKLIRRGMDSEFVVARFRTERQILAGLTHPGIAALLDGGSTEDGRPYFVMEHVAGEPIDQWCDARRLPVRERIALFLPVCDAVQHAHGRLVVHRDLKPGNILVTPAGQPKLLDFGLAKLLDPSAEADRTSTQLRFFTPSFASPEQIRGAPVTAASDVFSLGALLYLLLTGRRPFGTSTSSLEELARASCQDEPLRASAAAVAPAGEGHPTSHPEARSEVREGSPERLRRRLVGDLDAIVEKALRKEPEERYRSAEHLAEDLRRWLDGRPVEARRGSGWYRARRLAWRHRTALATATLVLLTAAAGVAGIERQRQRAERRFDDVRRLANSFLFEFHDSIADLPGSMKARQLVVQRAQEYLDSLAGEASGDAALQEELAAAYEKLAAIRGGWAANVGRAGDAVADQQKAVDIREALARARPDDAQASMALARALGELGVLEASSGKPGQAHAQRAVELTEQAAAAHPGDVAAERELAEALLKLGRVRVYADTQGADGSALALFERATALLEKAAAAEPGNAAVRRSLAGAWLQVGRDLVGKDPRRSAELLRRCLPIVEERLRSEPGSVAARTQLSTVHFVLGNALAYGDDVPGALENHRRALALRQEVAAADPDDAQAALRVADSHCLIGSILEQVGRPAEALEPLQRAAARFEEIVRRDPSSAYKQLRLAQTDAELGAIEVALAKSERTPAAAGPHWRAARGWYERAQELHRALREEGKLTPEGARDSDENERQLAACDAALGGAAPRR